MKSDYDLPRDRPSIEELEKMVPSYDAIVDQLIHETKTLGTPQCTPESIGILVTLPAGIKRDGIHAVLAVMTASEVVVNAIKHDSVPKGEIMLWAKINYLMAVYLDTKEIEDTPESFINRIQDELFPLIDKNFETLHTVWDKLDKMRPFDPSMN